MKTIKIPVRSHVLKYLQFHLGEAYSISRTDPFGLMLFCLLQRQRTDSKRSKAVDSYKEAFLVGLEQFPATQYGLRNLSVDTIYVFNNYVHELIRAELHAYVDLATDHGQREKDSLVGFMAKYDFTETDISYDTLKKSWQRFRADQQKAKRRAPRHGHRKEVKELSQQLRQIAPTLLLAQVLGGRAAA